jgi:predicted short-subunit dehydrogenase-like oxidoreductase (DUF2520 family)
MAPESPSGQSTPVNRCAVVGAGRVGTALAASLPGWDGPFGRGFTGNGYDVVLLAVPDAQITTAAAIITPERLVGHCSGATGLDALGTHEAFGMHPLMTIPLAAASFAGAGAAIAGTTPRAVLFADDLARSLGMNPFVIEDRDRGAYHAAASIASNFLITLEDAAESLMRSVGASRRVLVPLVQAALDNWAQLGGEQALTGPIARGDEVTVARQRAAIAERSPDLLPLFDAMCDATRELARRRPG